MRLKVLNIWWGFISKNINFIFEQRVKAKKWEKILWNRKLECKNFKTEIETAKDIYLELRHLPTHRDRDKDRVWNEKL